MTKCPYCNYIGTNHETIDGITDYKDGDISFCISCGEISTFSGKGLVKLELNFLRKEEQEEIIELRKVIEVKIKELRSNPLPKQSVDGNERSEGK